MSFRNTPTTGFFKMASLALFEYSWFLVGFLQLLPLENTLHVLQPLNSDLPPVVCLTKFLPQTQATTHAVSPEFCQAFVLFNNDIQARLIAYSLLSLRSENRFTTSCCQVQTNTPLSSSFPSTQACQNFLEPEVWKMDSILQLASTKLFVKPLGSPRQQEASCSSCGQAGSNTVVTLSGLW